MEYKINKFDFNYISNSLEPDYVTIYVGSNDLLLADGTYYRAKQIIAHNDYNRPNFANDIALIRVHGPIVFTDKVQPIEYSSEEVPDGAVLQLTGWGAWQVSFQYVTLFQRRFSTHKIFNRLTNHSHDTCKSLN